MRVARLLTLEEYTLGRPTLSTAADAVAFAAFCSRCSANCDTDGMRSVPAVLFETPRPHDMAVYRLGRFEGRPDAYK